MKNEIITVSQFRNDALKIWWEIKKDAKNSNELWASQNYDPIESMIMNIKSINNK